MREQDTVPADEPPDFVQQGPRDDRRQSGGERLGTIQSVMLDKRSGQVEYTVLGFGGLFGLGADHYPLPWQVLTYDPARGGYVAHISKDALGKAPRYSNETEAICDLEYERALFGHFGHPFS